MFPVETVFAGEDNEPNTFDLKLPYRHLANNPTHQVNVIATAGGAFETVSELSEFGYFALLLLPFTPSSQISPSRVLGARISLATLK